MEKMISARINLTNYSNRVLGVMKAKYDLKDKSEALNKFFEVYGEDLVEKEVSDEYLKKVIKISENHEKRFKGRKMSLKELDSLCEENV